MVSDAELPMIFLGCTQGPLFEGKLKWKDWWLRQHTKTKIPIRKSRCLESQVCLINGIRNTNGYFRVLVTNLSLGRKLKGWG